MVKIKRSTKPSEAYAPLSYDYRNNASDNSIPQKKDLSTDSEKKYALKKKKGAESGEAAFDEYFAKAEIAAYERETRQAQNTAKAYKEGNKILNRKLEESRAETERYLYENRQY